MFDWLRCMLHVFALFGFVGSIALPTMEASGHQLVEVAAVAACGTPSKPSKHKLAFLARRVCGKQTIKLDKRGRSSEWRRLRATLPKNEKVEKGLDLLMTSQMLLIFSLVIKVLL